MLVKISKRMIMGYIIFLCVFMVSCAPQLNLAKTTVSKLPHDCKPFQKKLYVKEITGIKLSHFDGLSSVNNVIDLLDLRKTICTSISQTNIFELSDLESCDFILIPFVYTNKYTQGLVGEMIFELEVLYKLIEKKSDKIIWESRINSTATKTVIDALIGPTRSRLALEATLKENSEKLVNEMAKIKLPKE